MGKFKQYILVILVMSLVAIISLVLVSGLTYLFKWQADKAMIGIIFTYIVVGFAGGQVKRRLSEKSDMMKRLLEGVCLGTLFAFGLVVLSLLFTDYSFVLSKRFFMIWFLLMGSSCVGRIL